MIITKTDNESKRTKIDNIKKEKRNRRSLNFFFFHLFIKYLLTFVVNNVKCVLLSTVKCLKTYKYTDSRKFQQEQKKNKIKSKEQCMLFIKLIRLTNDAYL